MVENRRLLRYAVASVGVIDGVIPFLMHTSKYYFNSQPMSFDGVLIGIFALFMFTASILAAIALFQKDRKSRLVFIVTFPAFVVYTLVRPFPLSIVLLVVNVLAFVVVLRRNPAPREDEPDALTGNASRNRMYR